MTVSAVDFVPAKFSVPAGYTIELVAGPPLIHHPTLACLDDQGRLFVADNAGVNLSAADLEKELPNTVRMLEDTNGDGRFDKSTLFADKMTYPMGGAWHNGALYVASVPWYQPADPDPPLWWGLPRWVAVAVGFVAHVVASCGVLMGFHCGPLSSVCVVFRTCKH